MRALAIACLLLTPATAAAQDEKKPFDDWDQGEWSVYWEDNFGPECWVQRFDAEGNAMTLSVDRNDDRLFVSVVGGNWPAFAADKPIPVTLHFAATHRSGTASGDGTNAVSISFDTAAEDFATLRFAGRFVMSVAGQPDYSTPLDPAAMREFAACVTVLGGVNSHPGGD